MGCKKGLSLIFNHINVLSRESSFHSLPRAEATVPAAQKLFQITRQCVDRVEKLFLTELQGMPGGSTSTPPPSPSSSTPSSSPSSSLEDHGVPIVAALPLPAGVNPMEEVKELNAAAHLRAEAKIQRLRSLPVYNPKDMIKRDQQIQEISLELMREYACNLAVAQEKQRRFLADQKMKEKAWLEQQHRPRDRRTLKEIARPNSINNNNTSSQVSLTSTVASTSQPKEVTVEDGGGDDSPNLLLKWFGTETQMLRLHLAPKMNARPSEAKKIVIEFLLPQLVDPEHRFGQMIARWQQKIARGCAATLDRFHEAPDEEAQRQCFEQSRSELITSISGVHEYIAAQVLPELTSAGMKDDSLLSLQALDSYVYCAVERAAFSTTFEQVFSLYQWFYRNQDVDICQSINRLITASPGHLGVEQQYWLVSSTVTGQIEQPYLAAILKMKGIPMYRSVDEKITGFVNSLKEIPLSIDRFFQSRRSSSTTIGSDDLLPIVAWCVIKANLPCLASEIAFLEDFLHSFSSQGECGFTLVTIQAAVGYISGLDTSSLAKNLSEVGPIAGAISSQAPVSPLSSATLLSPELFPFEDNPQTPLTEPAAPPALPPHLEEEEFKVDGLDQAELDRLMDEFDDQPSYL